MQSPQPCIKYGAGFDPWSPLVPPEVGKSLSREVKMAVFSWVGVPMSVMSV